MSNAPIVEVTPDRINYRASSIGSCMRALYASRLGYVSQDPPAVLQKAFDAGHQLEPIILDRLHDDLGWQLDGFQQPLEMHVGTNAAGQQLYLTGHVDCVGSVPGGSHYIPVDAKAFAQSTWDRFFSSSLNAFPHYSWQLSAYAVMLGLEDFAFAVYNKATEELRIRQGNINETGIGYDAIQSRIFQVELFWQQQMDLSTIECPSDYGCRFSYLHDVQVTDQIPDDLQQLVANYNAAKIKEQAFKKIKETIATQITPNLPYTDDLRTFTGQGLTVTVVSNSKRLDTQKIKELLTEAGVDIEEFYNPGEGVHIVVKEKKT